MQQHGDLKKPCTDISNKKDSSKQVLPVALEKRFVEAANLTVYETHLFTFQTV